MKKKISVGLITIAIVAGSIATYSISSKSVLSESDTDVSIVTDKNGKVIEPIDSNNNNLGH